MNRPTTQKLGETWPFTGVQIDVVKREPSITPTYDIGQRVLCNGTPGAIDAAYRTGGIGTVDHVVHYVAPITKAPQVLVYVILDDARDQRPQLYHPHEIKVAPTL